MDNYNTLLNKKILDFAPSELDTRSLDAISHSVNDDEYILFLSEICNGGFFHERSLQLYGACVEPQYQNILLVNHTIAHEYGSLADGLFFFAQDVFGNQFAFSHEGITYFNIETADREVIANNFSDWIKVVEIEEFYTGIDFVSAWKKEKGELTLGERLCAKIPFVMGGEYDLKNFYLQSFPKYILSNANIARQVHNLGDGTDVKIVIEE